MDDAEEWRAIPSWPNYEASSLGRVRSIDHWVASGIRNQPQVLRRGKVLTSRLDRQGRSTVAVTRDGKNTQRWVHLLVAEAFHGPRPAGVVTRHLNDDRTDNRPINLAYGTRFDNWADGVRNGIPGLRVKQDQCSRGHDLVPPNRTAYHPCTACNRAYTAIRQGQGYGRFSSDVQVVSDWYYAELMNPDPARPRKKVNPT